jgi:hypothetical protein
MQVIAVYEYHAFVIRIDSDGEPIGEPEILRVGLLRSPR